MLAVPGSSERFIEKSRGLPVDALFLDLEDAVAPAAKVDARAQIVAALKQGGWQAPTITVRVNDWDTPWTTADVLEVVGGAGAHIDAIVLPKVRTAEQVIALDQRAAQVGVDTDVDVALGLVDVGVVFGHRGAQGSGDRRRRRLRLRGDRRWHGRGPS